MADTAVLDAPVDTGAPAAPETGLPEAFLWEDGEPSAQPAAETEQAEAVADADAEPDGEPAPEQEEPAEDNPFAGLTPEQVKAKVDEMVAEARKDAEARARESERQRQESAREAAVKQATREQYAARVQQAIDRSPAKAKAYLAQGFQQVIAKAAETGEAYQFNPQVLDQALNGISQDIAVTMWEGFNGEHRAILDELGYQPDTKDLELIQDATARGDPTHAARTWTHLMYKASYGAAYAEARKDVEAELQAADKLRQTHEAVTKANAQPQPLRVAGTTARQNFDQIIRGTSSDPKAFDERAKAFERKYGVPLA
jgi:hypothetical protein